MPKTNPKAVEARARKEAAATEKAKKNEKQAEDALWEDNDKHVKRKENKKDEAEKKEKERLLRKQEAAKLLEQETEALNAAKPKAAKPVKKSQYEIDRLKAEREAEAARLAEKKSDLPELQENLNRVDLGEGSARNVDEALDVLNKDGAASSEPIDMHPEKRMKAAYLEFEETRLPQLKKDFPGMRLSQFKEIMRKEWTKSPKNPLNRAY